MSHPYPPPAKRRSPLPWILGGLAVVLLLCGGFLAIGALADNGDSDRTSSAGAPSTTAAAVVEAPGPGDFKLSAKIVEQTCYGEAGCAVTWQPVLTYTGPAIPDGQSWLVRYEVSGVESGTSAGTIVVGSTGPAKQHDKRNRTAGKDSKIVLKVTGVERDE